MAKAPRPAGENPAENSTPENAGETQVLSVVPVSAPAEPPGSDSSEPNPPPSPTVGAPPADSLPGPTLNDGLTDVVVLAKRSVRHEGRKHREHTKITLPDEEAERLQKLGFVITLEESRAQALALESGQVKATVTVGDGVRIYPE